MHDSILSSATFPPNSGRGPVFGTVLRRLTCNGYGGTSNRRVRGSNKDISWIGNGHSYMNYCRHCCYRNSKTQFRIDGGSGFIRFAAGCCWHGCLLALPWWVKVCHASAWQHSQPSLPRMRKSESIDSGQIPVMKPKDKIDTPLSKQNFLLQVLVETLVQLGCMFAR
jgi:hypothetical protein